MFSDIDWKRFFKKYWMKSLVIGFILLILIPWLINWLYKQNWGISWLQMSWKAETVLSFYGTILAAGIGIVGVFFSIQYAQKSYKDDVRNQALPYFSIIQLRGRSKYNPFTAMFDQVQAKMQSKIESNNIQEDANKEQDGSSVPDEGILPKQPMYEESELKRAYFVIGETKISCYTEMPADQRAVLEKNGITLEKSKEITTFMAMPYISSPLYAENVGNGAAICTRIGFYKNDQEPEYLMPIQLKKGDRFYIHIFSTVSPERAAGEYTLSFEYQDIYKNKYRQNFPYIVGPEAYHLSLDVDQERY